MDSNKTMALVPYEPKRKKENKTELIFACRRSVYILLLLISVAFIFIGFWLSRGYAAEGDTESLFGLIQDKSSQGIYISAGTRLMLFATLLMFISAWTIFSPMAALSYGAYISFRAGLFLGRKIPVLSMILLTIFLFFSIMYETEVFLAYNTSRYGIKQIFKPQNVISISVKTIIYVIIILLYGLAAGL